MLWPILERVEKGNGGKWTIIKIDCDNQELQPLAEQHRVAGIPTLAFYKDGKLVHQKSGFSDQAAFKKLEEKYLL